MAQFTIDVATVPSFPSNPSANDCGPSVKAFISSKPAGSVFIFPAGNYLLQSQMADITESSITLRGEGAGSTIFQLDGDTLTESLVKVSGSSEDNQWFRMQDLSFRGDGDVDPTSNSIIFLTKCAYTRIDRVDMFFVPRPGLRGRGWKDSVCRDVHFRRVGDATNAQMVVQSTLDSTPIPSSNLKFEECRWENNENSHCLLQNVSQAFFSACKFHGSLTGAENTQAHLFLEDCYITAVLDSHLTTSDVELIRAEDCSGLLVSGCVLDRAYRDPSSMEPNKACIRFVNGGYSVVTANAFHPTGSGVDPVYPLTISTNLITENVEIP